MRGQVFHPVTSSAPAATLPGRSRTIVVEPVERPAIAPPPSPEREPAREPAPAPRPAEEPDPART